MDSLERLFEEADDLVKEARENPLERDIEYDPGFVSSFAVYPIGAGLSYVTLLSTLDSDLSSLYSVKAFYHVRIAQSGVCTSVEEVADHFQKARGEMTMYCLLPWFCLLARSWMGWPKGYIGCLPRMSRLHEQTLEILK